MALRAYDNRILAIEQLPTTNFVDLVKVAELDPASDFRSTDLRGLDFADCDLSGFDFRGSIFDPSQFEGATLHGLLIDNYQIALLKQHGISYPPSESDTRRPDELARRAISISNGSTSKKIVSYLSQLPFLSGTVDPPVSEGVFLPGRYEVREGTPVAELLSRMHAEQEEFVKSTIESAGSVMGPLKGANDLIVLSSIVARESRNSGQEAKLAEVFKNRLRRNMKLQSDVTLLYDKFGSELVYPQRISRPDLEADRNGYNTYVRDGLPVGPVSNPGKPFIHATAHAADSKVLFYCQNGRGGFNFAETMTEHIRHVAEWRNMERSGRTARDPRP